MHSVENSTRGDVNALSPGRMAVLQARLEGVTSIMSNILLRTGRSGVLNRARDFSCCIVDAKGDLLASADALPIHVLAGPDIMARYMTTYHQPVQRGQAFLNNSPYHGCSHAADHTLLVPVMGDDAVHRFTVLVKAHQADIGNSIPTTYFGGAVDVYHEGALIFPCVKVQENYIIDEDFIRTCRMRIRVPDQWYGDFLAMVAATRAGERELMRLGGDVGWDELAQFGEALLDSSERQMVDAIAKLPSGFVTGESTHDPIPGTPAEGVTVKVSINVAADEGRIHLDLNDNISALPCGLNVSEACTRTAAMIGVFNCIDPSVPKNSGSVRRISFSLKENGVVGIPQHPLSCSVATTNLADRISNAVHLAFAKLAPDLGMAEVGGMTSPACAVISGHDPRRGDKPFVNQVFLSRSGGAATPHSDAWITTGPVGSGGMCFIDSVELAELYQPIVVIQREYVCDTEGAGRFVGAPQCETEFRPVGCDVAVNFVSDGTTNSPQGANGGLGGFGAEQYLRKADGELVPLDRCCNVVIHAGESVVGVASGGGGYGNPELRDPSFVVDNVREGYLSAARARSVYGVVIDADGGLDVDATAQLRGQHQGQQHTDSSPASEETRTGSHI